MCCIYLFSCYFWLTVFFTGKLRSIRLIVVTARNRSSSEVFGFYSSRVFLVPGNGFITADFPVGIFGEEFQFGRWVFLIRFTSVERMISCLGITAVIEESKPQYPNPTFEEFILKFVGYENKCTVDMVVGYLYRLWSRTAHLPFFSVFKKNSSRKMFEMVIA